MTGKSCSGSALVRGSDRMSFLFRCGHRIAIVALALGIVTAGVVAPLSQARAELAPATIIVVDVQKILQESKAAQGIQKQLDGQRQAFQTEISGQEDKLRAQEQELARQRSVLSADAFEQKRVAFEKQVADLQRTAQNRKRILDQAFNDSLGVVRNQMFEIVADIASEQGAKLVLSKSQVVLVEKSLDITATVMERLDKKLPQVAVSMPKN
ncbi:MAG: OmpH family outer membrane protein [Azospirillaceae bacterium]|nr:OmpH family outer membrane protein [Azospirillaceae bacterium]